MNTILEPARHVPVKQTCDVLVAGGGIAGIAAALAAARRGKRTMLLERGWQLGGLATAGLITIYLPLCDGVGHQLSYGIAEELLWLTVKHHSEGDYPTLWREEHSVEERKAGERFLTQYNPSLFALEAEKLLTESGVSIFYGASVCGVHKEGEMISAVMVETPSGRHAIEVESVVDATGDAVVCALSGAKTALFQQGNILAAWYYEYNGKRVAKRSLGACDVPETEKKAGRGETPELLLNRRFGGLDAEELSEMMCISHQKMLQDILKHREENPEYLPVTIPTMPQVRMTRRLVGAYTQDDTENGVSYADSVGMFGDWRKRGPAYELPFSTLWGKEIPNLIAAGRCISVTDAMWDITRVIPVCAVTGEAAGTAASLGNDFSKLDVAALQAALREQGVKLHREDLAW